MKTLILVIVLALLAGSAFACTGFLTGSRVSGMSRVCYYNHLGDSVAITIKSTQLCPLNFRFPH